MRCYHFCLYQLSQIQQGIQSAHAQTELFIKYRTNPESNEHSMLWDWAENHKTMICLSGGNSCNLDRLYYEVLNNGAHNLPFAKFNEDQASMCGLMTNIAVIVPEYIYGHNNLATQSNQVSTQLTDFELQLCDTLQNMRLI